MSGADHYQAVIDRYQAERRLPSLVAGVVAGARLTWSGTAGAASSIDTQFRIGSITKTMTAVLVLQCRDEGQLDLDDPIGRFVPARGYAGATVRELLAHVSGMQSEPVGSWWERSPGVSVDRLLSLNDGSGAVFGPGEHFHYSNLGYALLGDAVVRLRGEPWREVLAARLLAPLGMSRTTYLPEPPYAEGFSVHHLAGTLTPEPVHDTVSMAPAGQLWSTVQDLAVFTAFLMHGNTEVLADESLAQMRQPVTPAVDYGLGVRLVPYGEGVLAGHTGSMPGFQATSFGDPLNAVGVVAVTNGTTGFSGSELALALLGDHTPARLDPWTPTTQVPEWAGELLGYWHWGNSAFEVRWHNQALEWRDLARSTVAERFARSGARIVGVAGYHHGETLHVVRHEDGSIRRLECATFVYTRKPYEGG